VRKLLKAPEELAKEEHMSSEYIYRLANMSISCKTCLTKKNDGIAPQFGQRFHLDNRILEQIL
jgi:hypothetical protein